MSLNFDLSEEQKILKKSIAEVIKKFEPRFDEFAEMIMKQRKFPQEVWDAICETGLMGAIIPDKYGGSDMGLLSMTLALEEMAANGFGNAMFILTTMGACTILRNGSEEIKNRFLPEIASGKIKMSFALTEPDAGSNIFRIKTIAKKKDNFYRISGQKIFITGADVADYMLLVCRTISHEELKNQNMPKVYGLSLFVVDMKTKGLEMSPIPTRGAEGSSQFTLYMENIEVPAENLIGEENMGSMVMFNSLNPERILTAATAVGLSENLIKKSVEYAKQRKVFQDKPIAYYQAIQHPLADAKIELEAVRLLTYKAAWAFDKGWHPGQVGTLANMAKYLGAELAIKTVDRAIETFGGYGFSEENVIIYYWEIARLFRTAPISKEMILNYISEHELGLPRSY